ncbi:hypothetical protein BJ508DRAFT_417960 [Ascobolus immersus RN42]|uniref:Uncharacterized protein n=1 Tax=Ascobolus immersus RN42 TaxID=1160509 RepID=A0A3N4HTE1_ASCIM|nr:hypothetical protein BJ508DRAFT_417960 [Ascobolus immersus RN42]
MKISAPSILSFLSIILLSITVSTAAPIAAHSIAKREYHGIWSKFLRDPSYSRISMMQGCGFGC